ncbi:hypothetical protein ACVWWO_000962 [Bradyrhizobium sp. F1.13.1]
MADPLSSATRATKRNLLISSVLAISANAFNISIDKIPLAGLSVNFDDRLFAFLLVVALAYFLCTFVLYYVIDIKNLEPTAHQDTAEKWYEERILGFPSEYSGMVHQDLQKYAPEGFLITTSFSFAENGEVGTNTYEIQKRSGRRQIQGASSDRLSRGENEPVFALVDDRLASLTKRYSGAFAKNRLKARTMVGVIRTTYAVRNYILDGALPIGLGIFALVAILGHLDLHWIQNFLPTFKVLTAPPQSPSS